MKVTIIPIVIGAFIYTRTGGHRNKWTSEDLPNYSIVEICQNTEESPGDLRIFVVTQIPMRNYWITLVWKTRKGVIIIKARHDWVGSVINWKLCKKFIFDRTNKSYIHNPEPIQENETHKLLSDF